MKNSFILGTLITFSIILTIISFILNDGNEIGNIYKMKVYSPSFENGNKIPNEFVNTYCGGKNISPDLEWENIPDGTQSFAIIANDIDSKKRGGFYNWILIDIPAYRTAISKNEKIKGSRILKNDYNEFRYGGPCSQKGIHKYNFTIYALNTDKLDVSNNDLPKDIEAKVSYHAIETAKLSGYFKKYENR